MAQRSFDVTGNVVWVDATGGGSFEELADPAGVGIRLGGRLGLTVAEIMRRR